MSSNREQYSVAVLDDYQNVALTMADWSVLEGRAAVTVFNDHISDVDAVVSRLLPFDIVCVMRERTPMTRAVIERLPRLRLIASTAWRNASIDVTAAEARGVQVVHTGYTSAPTIELTWALILAGARHIVDENTSLRGGGWQRRIGEDLGGKTLGLLGLGNIGSAVARIGKAFGMNVIAWSQNLTAERAGIGFPIHPHMLRHACGYALANRGTDTRTLQAYLGHRNIQHTVHYTELASTRFRNLWGDD